MTSQTQINEFWNWFATNASEFGDTFENESLLLRLDEFVTGLGDFAWEVGPGDNGENMFSLSPAGSRDLLVMTKAIIDAAPHIPGWQLYPAKPAKHWAPRFEIRDANGDPFVVDATTWRCALLKYPDGTHEVVVEAPNLGSLSEDYQRWAAEVALDGLLGEQCRLENIDEVSVVPEFTARERFAAFPLTTIRDRIR